jgi:hypothetical protein
MGRRKLLLNPSDEYEFVANATYASEWRFLPTSCAKTLAAQLTYLAFHEWLQRNLKHQSKSDSVPSSLVFDIADGFYKTDILLYASICEAALHAVLKRYYENLPQSSNELSECFVTDEAKWLPLSKQKFTTQSDGLERTGILCLKWTISSEVEIRFIRLIKAGFSLNLYQDTLKDELTWLRKARNSVHLAIEPTKPKSFTEAERSRAKDITEALRKALMVFCATPPSESSGKTV